ncbi:hypothetical protein DOM22_11790 [Bdellovibrio sp. ZAP7]|nr:hypothetical protein DOM22_11790 [Bdellovibrio sp. ZAP7]
MGATPPGGKGLKAPPEAALSLQRRQSARKQRRPQGQPKNKRKARRIVPNKRVDQKGPDAQNVEGILRRSPRGGSEPQRRRAPGTWERGPHPTTKAKKKPPKVAF